MKMMKLRIRTRLIINRIISVAVIISILVISYLNHKLLETTITMILFYIFRRMFDKQYHSYSIYGCALVSVIVFLIIIALQFNLSESILFSVIITFLVNLISYYVKDYLDTKNKVKKMHTKRLEELSEEELLRTLPDIKQDIIHITYNYLHRRKGVTANEFAYNYNISEPLVYKYVKQVKDAYKNLTN